MFILSDLVNALISLIIIIIALRIKIIPNWIAFVLGIYSFIPFFLNEVLFPTSYFSDQFIYTKNLEEVRSLNFFSELNPKSYITIWLLSLLPLPFAETVQSMGFYNRLLFLILFLWLYRKNFLSGMSLKFLIFYPSLILYTSLSLRDTVITFVMIIGIISFIDKKYIRCFFSTIILYLIKFQNAYLMIIFYIILLFFNKKTLFFKYRYFFLILTIFIFSFILNDLLYYLEVFRSAFFWENQGDLLTYRPIDNLKNLIILSLSSSINILIKPMFWEANNLFQIIQSIENFFVLIFLIIFTKKAYSQNRNITIKYLLILFVGLTVYGLIVFNYGALARYKFPFIVLYVLGLSYELFKYSGYQFGNIFTLKIKKIKKNNY